MFNLEHSIKEWRQQMLAAGIKSPAPLEELESHLRDEIEQQLRSGLSESEAFAKAAKSIGSPAVLKAEFKKGKTSLEARFVQLAGIACGTIALVFLTLIFPKFFLYSTGWTLKILGLIAIIPAAFCWRFAPRILPVIHHRRLRALAGLSCCVASIAGMLLFAYFIPDFVIRVTRSPNSIGLWLFSFIWAWTLFAILGATAHGLEEAARTRVTTTAL